MYHIRLPGTVREFLLLIKYYFIVSISMFYKHWKFYKKHSVYVNLGAFNFFKGYIIVDVIYFVHSSN